MNTYKWSKSSTFLIVIILNLAIVLSACTAPEVKFAQKAKNYGFEKNIIHGTLFKHVVFTKPSIHQSRPLHIYLNGDGSPWINQRWKSSNPTPRNSLMLHLMQQDSSPAVYLARPCYQGFSKIPPCTSQLWTSHRYSPTVLKSMAQAINTISKKHPNQQLVLIGHSGGGTLAILLTKYLKKIMSVITIAANLDTEAWTKHHGYTPLSGSLNPAQQPPLAKNIFQLHLAGTEDTNVLSEHIQSFVKKQFSAQFQEIKNYDHHCCWEEIWPSILKRVTLQNQ